MWNATPTGAQADTLEGRIVRLADRVAYINHDIDDAVRAGVLREEDVPEDIRCALGDRRTTRIDTLVTSIVNNSGEDIAMDPETEGYFQKLHAFMFEALYRNPIAKSEESKVDGLVGRMFSYFVEHPDHLPAEYTAIREREGVPAGGLRLHRGHDRQLRAGNLPHPVYSAKLVDPASFLKNNKQRLGGDRRAAARQFHTGAAFTQRHGKRSLFLCLP